MKPELVLDPVVNDGDVGRVKVGSWLALGADCQTIIRFD